MCLTKKTHELEKLCWGMSYSVADHEFSANESHIYKW
jgi:hypothetical protein